jgi:hypothetical protein
MKGLLLFSKLCLWLGDKLDAFTCSDNDDALGAFSAVEDSTGALAAGTDCQKLSKELGTPIYESRPIALFEETLCTVVGLGNELDVATDEDEGLSLKLLPEESLCCEAFTKRFIFWVVAVELLFVTSSSEELFCFEDACWRHFALLFLNHTWQNKGKISLNCTETDIESYFTWTRDSGKLIFNATSSLINTSGYLVFWKSVSNTSNCCRENVVRSRRCFFTIKRRR